MDKKEEKELKGVLTTKLLRKNKNIDLSNLVKHLKNQSADKYSKRYSLHEADLLMFLEESIHLPEDEIAKDNLEKVKNYFANTKYHKKPFLFMPFDKNYLVYLDIYLNCGGKIDRSIVYKGKNILETVIINKNTKAIKMIKDHYFLKGEVSENKHIFKCSSLVQLNDITQLMTIHRTADDAERCDRLKTIQTTIARLEAMTDIKEIYDDKEKGHIGIANILQGNIESKSMLILADEHYDEKTFKKILNSGGCDELLLKLIQSLMIYHRLQGRGKNKFILFTKDESKINMKEFLYKNKDNQEIQFLTGILKKLIELNKTEEKTDFKDFLNEWKDIIQLDSFIEHAVKNLNPKTI